MLPIKRNFKKFACICVPDEDSLCAKLAESEKKSIIFVDSKEKAKEFRTQILNAGGIIGKDITILNADNIGLESNNEVIRNLTIAHKLIPKILITTSVLDNGVSIHDGDVGNVVCLTESKISFVQMLGRIRTENVDKCNLYFVLRGEAEFRLKMQKYERECNLFKNLGKEIGQRNYRQYIYTVWDGQDDEMSDFYKMALVYMDSKDYHMDNSGSMVRARYTGMQFYVNKFAEIKVGDMFLRESRFYSLAVRDPLEVVYEQMSWLGKSKDELQFDVEYQENKRGQFIEELQRVKDYTKEELAKFKVQLVKSWRKDFFPDILANNKSISNDKLCAICGKFGLSFVEETENRRKKYSIR